MVVLTHHNSNTEAAPTHTHTHTHSSTEAARNTTFPGPERSKACSARCSICSTRSLAKSCQQNSANHGDSSSDSGLLLVLIIADCDGMWTYVDRPNEYPIENWSWMSPTCSFSYLPLLARYLHAACTHSQALTICWKTSSMLVVV